MVALQKLSELADVIAEDIAKRKRLESSDPQHGKITITIQRNLKQLETEILMKDEEIKSIKNRSEYLSLSGQLAALNSRREELEESFLEDGGTLAPSEERSLLMRLFTKKIAAKEEEKKRKEKLLGATTEELLEKKERLFQEQDVGIDILAETVARQKDLAVKIGDEVNTHNKILDKMQDRVDSTDVRVKKETLRVADFAEDTSNLCPYYTFIIVLVVVIVFLVTI